MCWCVKILLEHPGQVEAFHDVDHRSEVGRRKRATVQVEADKASGLDVAALSSSKVVVQTTDSLEVIAAGGGERPKDQSDDPDKVQYCSRGTTHGAAHRA